jgi:predicted acetyltransferase
MEIRPAQKKDIRPLAELWAHAFPGERTVEQRIRQLEAGGVYGGIESAFIVSEDAVAGALAAFRPYRMQQYMHGAPLPMMGLAAVAVAEHGRRRGIGAELCRFALRHAYDRGDVLSVLYPFRPSFYEALGWGLAGRFESYVFRPSSLRVTHPEPHVRPLDDAVDVIAPCYERVAAASNGLIVRTPRIWRQHLDWADVHTFALRRNGMCAGYAIVHQESGDSTERALTVRELVAVDDDAYDEVMSWLALRSEPWSTIRYDARQSERLDLRLSEPRTPLAPVARTLFAPVATVIRGPMLRVVNVRAALTGRVEWGLPDFAFRLSVADAELPENTGPFDVGIRNGRCHFGGDVTPTAEIDTDACTFAQIYAGELSPTEAARLHRARVEGDGDALDALFRARREFELLDEF